MSPSPTHRPARLRAALLASALVVALLPGAAGASGFGPALDLESALPWSTRPARGFHLDDPTLLSPREAAEEPPHFRLVPSEDVPSATVAEAARWSPQLSPQAGDPPRKDRSTLVAGGFTLAFLGLEYLAFWQSSSISDDFQWANEGWFDPNTYTGGADKASHLVGGFIAGRFLEAALRWGGGAPGKSQFLSATMIAVTGTLIEVGDAYHGYGFSWQDAVITAAGGIGGSVLSYYKLDDTITMRFGMVGIDYPDDPSIVVSDPNHYSGEIYTLDVRGAGLLPRLGASPGLARFLLASVTYGTKGYPWVEAPYRQRRLGLEIGLDTYEIGLALGLRKDSWWGGPLLGFLRYFRLPYTALGFQYEFNSRRWMGPNSFHDFDR